MPTDLVRVTPEHTGFPAAATLFDDYRAHYGHPSDPSATAGWLARQITAYGLTLTVALRNGRPAGLITTLVLPASLRLGQACSVRDLFVDPAQRRNGVARALMEHAIAEARTTGALRISLQTEPGNAAAQALYAELGFRPVPDLDSLTRTLRS
ncbi:N-acetyltransferase [Actinoplanes lobatus]|uniref:N-acetyltransferase n=1 Tax=Actinoplanes lobatus TaxID=113568 RepID=A0A7W7MFU3_9ACTN|nr:GNAT family N-acetyltransferase [Actinoplanes lobatus]MBB4748638.1 GNAT superfamily N-acetyltransferase [Actinoplanes lobatus]GGN58168.1 N-acetyltransferase [Actinoplanes lobatus]GIE37461.1 N-acetyltransferase [Actinoplanes lobatus]